MVTRADVTKVTRAGVGRIDTQATTFVHDSERFPEKLRENRHRPRRETRGAHEAGMIGLIWELKAADCDCVQYTFVGLSWVVSGEIVPKNTSEIFETE